MPFMQPQVEHGRWYVIDGPAGTECVPADLVGVAPTGTRATLFPVPAPLRDYCENRECWSVELRDGWGARLSAPGYLDCTPWSVFDTRAEAEAHLRDTYDPDEEDDA